MRASKTIVRTGAFRRRGRVQRAMRVAMTVAASIALTAVGIWALAAARPAPASAATHSRPRVVILVLAPYLTFSDLSPQATPALWKLAEDGAIGAVNARTGDPGDPNAASGALTISAGRWASVATGTPATAGDIEALQALQSGSLTRPVLGSLGRSVHAGGGRTAAVRMGPPQVGGVSDDPRPAELAAMDTSGVVDVALKSFSATIGPQLLVVESPGLAAAAESTPSSVAQAEAAHHAAVRELDDAVRLLRAAVPADAILMVVSPATHKSWYEDPDLGVAVVAGPGFKGELTSASTHRDGLVTTLDVAPTILAALGIERGQTMVGTAMSSRPTSSPLAQRLTGYAVADASTGIVDQLREAWFIGGFVVFALLAAALALWTIVRDGGDGTRRFASAVVLLGAAVPPAAWLALFVHAHPESMTSAIVAFGSATAVTLAGLLGVQYLTGGRRRERAPLAGAVSAALAVSSLTALVILADQWLGEPLRTGLFSYSVRSGWRYYGMGNEGAALLVGASLVAIGLTVDALAGSRLHIVARRWAIPILGAVVLVTAAGPFAGANAGVVIWGIVAFATAWTAMNGVRMRPKTIAITVALVAGAVVAFAAIDLATSSGGSTHLARFAGGILSGNLSTTGELVTRKLANNLGLFAATKYTALFIGLAVVFVAMHHGSNSRLRRALEPFPALRGALLGVFIGGLLALVTEDSSSVMPALMWLAALMPALMVALASRPSLRRDNR